MFHRMDVSGRESRYDVGETKHKRKIKFSEGEIARAEALYRAGMTLRDFKTDAGGRLSIREARVLHHKSYNYPASVTGRMSTLNDAYAPVHVGYSCQQHLAGGVFFGSEKLFYGKLDIAITEYGCGSAACKGVNIPVGGGYDGIVVVLPGVDFSMGWPTDVLGSKVSWSDDYRYAVDAAKLINQTLPRAKIAALYGTKFAPRTLFQDAVMVLCRMRGLQDVVFYNFRDHIDVFRPVELSQIGSHKVYTEFVARTYAPMVNHMTNCAWAFYELSKMGAEFEGVQVPLLWFLTNINKASRNTESALRVMRDQYRFASSQFTSEDRGVISVDSVVSGPVACNECVDYYKAAQRLLGSVVFSTFMPIARPSCVRCELVLVKLGLNKRVALADGKSLVAGIG